MVFFQKKCRLVGAFLALSVVMPLYPSYAGPSELDPACDSDFMDAMKQRAWMEVQRETEIAQTVIAKPDSVFDLTCFGSRLDLMFGDLTYLTVDDDTSAEDVGDNLDSYLGSNFDHGLGGEHAADAVDKDFSNEDCSVMQELWHAADCADQSAGSLMTLSELSGTDPREFGIDACDSNGGDWTDPKKTMTTPGAIDPMTAGTTFDPMNLFWGVTAPLSQTPLKAGDPEKCSPGIKTGVMMGDNPEVVCPNPGCSPTGGKTPKCCQTGTTSGSTCS